PGSGLIYYLYRCYNPNLQRWVSSDPIEERGGLNLHTFAFNDPTGLLDAFGLDDGKCEPKRNPEDHLPPENLKGLEKSMDVDAKRAKGRSAKSYDKQETGQQYEDLLKAKAKNQEAINSAEGSKQEDKDQLRQAGLEAEAAAKKKLVDLAAKKAL